MNRRFRALISALAFLSHLLLLTLTGGAQVTQPYVIEQPHRPRAHLDWGFTQGTVVCAVGGQVFAVGGDAQESIGFATIDLGFHLLDRLSVNVELGASPSKLTVGDPDDNGDQDTNLDLRAYEGLFLLRAHVIQRNRLSLYVDGGIGALHADGSFPRRGSRDNVLKAAGIGATWRLTHDLHAAAGARYVWMSGGDLFRSQGTRKSEGIQYYAGLTWAR